MSLPLVMVNKITEMTNTRGRGDWCVTTSKLDKPFTVTLATAAAADVSTREQQ
jgi:hypothetical protein